MISGITVGIAIFVTQMKNKFSRENIWTQQIDAVSMLNTYNAEVAVYRGTLIIGIIGMVFAEICIQMPFWVGIRSSVLCFGGLSTMVALAFTKHLESKLYEPYTPITEES